MANINQGYFEPHFLDIAYQVTLKMKSVSKKTDH